MNNKIGALDALRVVACLAVVFYHYIARSPAVGWMADAELPFLRELSIYGYLGVHLFFLISGFVILMTAQDQNIVRFIASRVARLAPAMWACAPITAGCAWAMSDSRFMISISDLLFNFSLHPHWFNAKFADGVYWSLAVELQFYVFIAMIVMSRGIQHIGILAVLWLLISLGNIFVPIWTVQILLLLEWAPLFVAGGTFYFIKREGPRPRLVALGIASLVLASIYASIEAKRLSLIYTKFKNGYVIDPHIAIGVLVAFFLLMLLVSTEKLDIKSGAWLTLCSALTYPMYLIHQNLGAMVSDLLLRHAFPPMAVLCLVAAASLATALLVHLWAERPLGFILKQRLMALAPTGR